MKYKNMKINLAKVEIAKLEKNEISLIFSDREGDYMVLEYKDEKEAELVFSLINFEEYREG